MTTTNPSDFNKRLGAAVRVRRLMRGYSQERLAALLGVTFQQQQKRETGKNRISTEDLVLTARFLDTTPQQLIEKATGDKQQDTSAELEGQPPRDRMKLQVMRGLSRMPEKSQRIALDVINALAGDETA